MKTSQYSTLTLNLIESSVQVSVIKLNPTLPCEIDMQRLLCLADFPALVAQARARPQCCVAVLFRSDERSQDVTNYLENMLTSGLASGGPSMIEFSSVQDAEDVFVLAHWADQSGLGQFLQNRQMGIFQFKLQNILDLNTVEQYIKEIHSTRSTIVMHIHSFTHQIERFQKETEACEQVTYPNHALKDKVELAKAAAQLLQTQVANQEAKVAVLEVLTKPCLGCSAQAKQVALFPCGHLVYCVDCAASCVPAQSFGSVLCCICHAPVTETQLVRFRSA